MNISRFKQFAPITNPLLCLQVRFKEKLTCFYLFRCQGFNPVPTSEKLNGDIGSYLHARTLENQRYPTLPVVLLGFYVNQSKISHFNQLNPQFIKGVYGSLIEFFINSGKIYKYFFLKFQWQMQWSINFYPWIELERKNG